MKRLYETLAQTHFSNHTQMLFLGGPRQVGKTTISKALLAHMPGRYFNWDNPEDRLKILGPYQQLMDQLPPRHLGAPKPLVVFDEIHKYKDWKNHLKGFFDTHKDACHILVTGSAKMDVYHRGGDSLMGRYFPYTIHPLSLREIVAPAPSDDCIQSPVHDPDNTYDRLYTFGGFPDPYIQGNSAFSNQWKQTRHQQLFREDIRDMGSVQQVDQLTLLAHVLQNQAGDLLNYAALSRKIRVTDQTIRRWLSILEAQYYCFSIKPWSHNVTRSLLKDPKVYLWDWSDVSDPGARFENFIACHLHKATTLWTEQGLGHFGLYFLRDKEQREVDFLVTRDNTPWFMVEAKVGSGRSLSPALAYFQKQIDVPHAFQVVHEMDYVHTSCFNEQGPLMVPARTLLSQLA